MYEFRKKLYEQIEHERNSKVIAYITGDRPGASISIMDDAISPMSDHLHSIGKVDKISFILYTRGGYVTVAWNIINLIREFCSELELIIPGTCHSSGTLIALGANKIIMTHDATLSPIDPHIENPLAPIIPGTSPTKNASVDVESVKKYFSFLSDFLRIKKRTSLFEAYLKLADKVNPIFIGDVYREQQQIRILAKKLLSLNYTNKKTIQQIISFLCDGNVAHSYTIHFTEAQKIGFNVEFPSPTLYDCMRSWLLSISNDLELHIPYRKENQINLLDDQNHVDVILKRGFIESLEYNQFTCISKSHIYKTPYIDEKRIPRTAFNEFSTFDGWIKT